MLSRERGAATVPAQSIRPGLVRRRRTRVRHRQQPAVDRGGRGHRDLRIYDRLERPVDPADFDETQSQSS